MSEQSQRPVASSTKAPIADRLQTEFISNVSHELRTPLHAIVGYVDLLQEGLYGALTPEQAQVVGYIHESASGLLDLVSNLLDLSRLESGRADLVLKKFDLRELVAELFRQFKPLADAKKLALELQVASGITDTVVRSDRGKLKQVLVNLLGNSLKFSETGRITVTIAPPPAAAAVPVHHSEHLLISVTDTGVGIPADQIDLIFERFHQVDGSAARAHEGTGLGLYIVKQLIDLLAATIQVQSTLGVGTTFTVLLPRNYEELESVQRLRDRVAGGTAYQKGQGEQHVLILSNDPHISRLLADGLSSAEYTVHVAPATNAALQLSEQLRPAVILLDAETAESPDEFWRLFRELKSHPATRDIPTVFLGQDEARRDGMPLTVASSFDRQEVLQSIRASTQPGKKRVLIVDDDAGLRALLAESLADEGYEVAEASDGRTAIEKLEELKPNLLLLDLHIPQIDGWGVIHHMTQNPHLRDCEVLVISGDAPTDDQAALIDSRTRGFISKADFKVNKFLDQIAKVLKSPK